MTMQNRDFKREWLRLLRINSKTADTLRRRHNREIMRQAEYEWQQAVLFEPESQVRLYWYEDVIGIENGKATAKRVVI